MKIAGYLFTHRMMIISEIILKMQKKQMRHLCHFLFNRYFNRL